MKREISIFNYLSKTYLTDKLGLDIFKNAQIVYKKLLENGLFLNELNDRELASALYEQFISKDFFSQKKNLNSFIDALPDYIKTKISSELGEDKLNWNDATFNYFHKKYNLSRSFEPFVSNEIDSLELSFIQFDNLDLYFKKLKKYQTQIFFEAFEHISSKNFARCIIQMPTGSGKTRTAMEIVSEFLNQNTSSVIWLANTEELCDQAFSSFKETWYFLRKKSLYAVNHQRQKRFDLYDIQGFHVSTLQGLRSKLGTEKIDKLLNGKAGLGLVIVDEAHISIAPTYKSTIKSLLSKEAKLIGLTATPGRKIVDELDRDEINDQNKELSEFYFGEKFTINTEGDEGTIDYLRELGILSYATFTSIEGSYVAEKLTTREINQYSRTGVMPQKIINALTNDVGRNAMILERLFSLLEQGKKIIYFATSINQSKMISTLVNLKGYKSQHVDGSTGSFRSSIIRSFRRNETQLLCNHSVLTTGFDDPKIDVVFMARPTNSIVLYSQIIGRGLRGPGIGGTDICKIFTVFDNIVGLPKDPNLMYSYFDNYFIKNDSV